MSDQKYKFTNSLLKDEINFRDLFNALNRRRKYLLLGFFTFLSLTILKTGFDKKFNPLYEGSFSLMITDPLSNQNKRNSGENSLFDFESLALNSRDGQDLQTLITFLKSPYMIKDIAEKYDYIPTKFSESLELSTQGLGRDIAKGIINVEFFYYDPDTLNSILIDLSQKYLNSALEQRQQRLKDGLDFLNQQAPEIRVKTAKIQDELSEFRRKNNILDPILDAQALQERIALLEDRTVNYKINQKRLMDIKDQINKGNLKALSYEETVKISYMGSDESTGTDGGLIISGVDQNLLTQLLEAETALAEAKTKYTSDSITIKSLKTKIDKIRPLLRENQLQSVNTALKSTLSLLKESEIQRKDLNKVFQKQPQLIKEYEDIIQRLLISQKNLEGLESAKEKFQLELAQGSYPWKVISPAYVNPIPASPVLTRNLAIGIVFGLFLGIAIALLRDRLDHVFHKSEELEDLGIPLLGNIPYVQLFSGIREEKSDLIEIINNKGFNNESSIDKKNKNYQRFFYQEAFRNLSASIRFLNTGKETNIISLTSSVPSEGKSLVTILLSKTIEEMGQKVILIDGDLRKPQMHTRIGLNNILGLSNYLTDPSTKVEKILQNVPGHKNWKVLTAGRIAPDPTRLLSSERMLTLIDDLVEKEKPDLILFDTPPVLGLADAALTAKCCDGIILLVGINKVDRGFPSLSLKRLFNSGIEVLGLISNEVSESKLQSSKSAGNLNKFDMETYAAYYPDDEDYDDNSESEDRAKQANNKKEFINNIVLIIKSINKKFKPFIEWLDK